MWATYQKVRITTELKWDILACRNTEEISRINK